MPARCTKLKQNYHIFVAAKPKSVKDYQDFNNIHIKNLSNQLLHFAISSLLALVSLAVYKGNIFRK